MVDVEEAVQMKIKECEEWSGKIKHAFQAVAGGKPNEQVRFGCVVFKQYAYNNSIL